MSSRWAARGLTLLVLLAPAVVCGPARAATPPSGHGSDDSLARVRTAGVLRWGGDEQGGEPYAFEDPAHPGTLIGFETEIAAALARALGVRAQFVQNDWPNLIPSLERGTFDVAMNGIEVTPARLGRVDFSRPYFFFTLRLTARQDDGRITDLASLRGHRAGTLAGTQAWQTLLDAGAKAVPYEGVDEPFIDLERGRTDAVLLDDIIVDRYAPRHPTVRVVGDVGDGAYAIAFRREDSTLRAAVDAALAQMIASGQLRDILARWRIDGPRQARLAIAPQAPVTTPGQPAAFGLRHLWLFVQGALVTLLVSAGAMVIAVTFGLALALARLYLPRAGRLAGAYIEIFRGTPVLLQLYLLYYGLAPVLRLDAFGAAILGLGLNYAAYEAEIQRAGILSVPPGQMEAALSLGMSRRLALRRIVLPQALRVALPGITNDFIAMLKDSSLVSVITVVELTKRMAITAVDTRGWLLPGLACAALYFAMSYPLARMARRWERTRAY
ncbi:MAG TPA: ABC transporter substrate-binding protein/permease [Burkholderiaceae bacterium]|nr:ABC transporter substrate-binding protein/permease [Burkholderiaceae bacterium]